MAKLEIVLKGIFEQGNEEPHIRKVNLEEAAKFYPGNPVGYDPICSPGDRENNLTGYAPQVKVEDAIKASEALEMDLREEIAPPINKQENPLIEEFFSEVLEYAKK